MRRPNPLYAIYVALVVVVGGTLAIAVGMYGSGQACSDGHMTADILASPIDGNAAVLSDGKIVQISAGYEGHEKIARAARASSFRFFHVPLRIKAICKTTERNGARHLVVESIEELAPVSDAGAFRRIYADFGIDPVRF